MILLSSTRQIDSFVQFITVLLIFLLVLVITYVVTRWIARFQKTQITGKNIEVIETQRISSSKYIQIIRIGERYFVIGVCKDTITMLSEINREEITFSEIDNMVNVDFKSVWEKVKSTASGKNNDTNQEK